MDVVDQPLVIRVNYKKTLILITIEKILFVKYVVLIFSLIRTASLSSILSLKNAKHLKISEELMPVAWYPKTWWNFYVSEDEKKEIKAIFYGGVDTFWDRKLCMNFLMCFFLQKIIHKDLKSLKIFVNFGLKIFKYLRRQNVSIPTHQTISQEAKCFNTPRLKYVPGSEIFQYPYLVYYCNILQK